MRRPLPWMMHADLYILSLLDETDMVLSPHIIAIELDYNTDYVGRRCSELTEADLLQRPEEIDTRGLFEISELGHRYVNDELTREEKRELEAFADPAEDSESPPSDSSGS